MTKSQKAALKLHLSPVPADGVCTVFCLARLTGRTLKGGFFPNHTGNAFSVSSIIILYVREFVNSRLRKIFEISQ